MLTTKESTKRGYVVSLDCRQKNGNEGDRNYEFCTKMGGGGHISTVAIIAG